MPRSYTCPGCQRVLKSTSGWTLHVKTCCPDLRYRKTRVKMEIEFDIPVPLDDMNNHGISVTASPLAFFNLAFWPKEIRKVGQCEMVSANLLEEPTIENRAPTYQEQARLKRSEMQRDANSANRECRRVAKVLIGEPKDLAVRGEGGYPETVTLIYAPKGLRAWQHRDQAKMTLTFRLKDETVEVGTGPVNKHSWPRIHKTVKTFRLADPECIEQIQKFTGFKP